MTEERHKSFADYDSSDQMRLARSYVASKAPGRDADPVMINQAKQVLLSNNELLDSTVAKEFGEQKRTTRESVEDTITRGLDAN